MVTGRKGHLEKSVKLGENPMCHSLNMSLMGKNYICLSLWLRLLMGYSWIGLRAFNVCKMPQSMHNM